MAEQMMAKQMTASPITGSSSTGSLSTGSSSTGSPSTGSPITGSSNTGSPIEPSGSRRAPIWRRVPGGTIAALLPLLFVACESVRKGPELTVQNPEGHRVYLDGRELPARARPRPIAFRYYGTTRWDALPVIPMKNGVPEFDRELRSELVEVPLPAPRWLFPFDFAIELVDRTLFGRRDQVVTVRVPEQPAATRLDADDVQSMRTRGRAARVAR